MAISVLAVGDVAASRSDPLTIFRGCRGALSEGDLLFGQLEATITDRGAKAPNARLAMRSPPAMAAAAQTVGFDVMSFAGNHCLDWGYEGFFDTLSHAAKAGLPLCGAGETLAEARRPVIVERDGLKIAFLAYSSILPEGYRAEQSRPGAAPIRAFTIFEQIEPDQPGTGARVLTSPHPGDLQALVEDVRSARVQADLVFVSLHWGLHMVEATIADYQPIVAYAAIDAGAHAIFGHHPHILKGIDFYRDAPIFYSLGNFAIDQPHMFDAAITQTESFRHFASLNPTFRADAVYMLPEDTRMTGIVRLRCSRDGVGQTEFLPAWVMDDSAPEMLPPDDPRFIRITEYLRRISEQVGFSTRFEEVNGALRITKD